MNKLVYYLLGVLTPIVLVWVWQFIDRNILGNRCVMGMTTIKDIRKSKLKRGKK